MDNINGLGEESKTIYNDVLLQQQSILSIKNMKNKSDNFYDNNSHKYSYKNDNLIR